jgi:DNA polymerase phi
MFSTEVTKWTIGNSANDAELSPVPGHTDVLVDTIIGFLEKSTPYMRAVSNEAFSLLSGSVQDTTIDLILAVSLHLTSANWAINRVHF